MAEHLSLFGVIFKPHNSKSRPVICSGHQNPLGQSITGKSSIKRNANIEGGCNGGTTFQKGEMMLMENYLISTKLTRGHLWWSLNTRHWVWGIFLAGLSEVQPGISIG
jgi:hypothetical protein